LLETYIPTAVIQEMRRKFTPEERRRKERALEELLAEFGVTRETLDEAFDELLEEYYAMAAGEAAATKEERSDEDGSSADQGVSIPTLGTFA